MSEAEQQEKKQMQWEGRSTDLSSFTAFGVVKLSDEQRVNVQMTNRHGLSAELMYADYKEYVRFLDMCAQDHDVEFWDGTRSNGDSKTPASVANKNSSEPSNGSGEKPKRNYKDPIPAAEVPAELADTNEDVYAAEFDLFKVLPQPDDKATVEFWKDGMEYPVGAKMNKWKHDTIKQALAKLTEQAIDPSKAAEYRIAGTVYHVLGNEYTITKGPMAGQKSRYKNLVLVLPAF